MEYTYLDYFNYYLKEYLSELVNTFPETREPILSNYRALLEGKDDKNDLYVKCYYTKINNFLSEIAKKDITLFETPGKIFIEGIDLYTVWNSSCATTATHTAIWKYLQILMILGRRIIPNHKEIIDILNKISNGDINVPAKVEKTLETKDETEDTPSVFGLGDIASSLGGLSSIMNGLGGGGSGGGGGGGISSLMSGLSGLMGGMGGGGSGGGSGGSGDALGGLSNLMGNITEMFNNPEFTNAMSQLSQQFVPPGTEEYKCGEVCDSNGTTSEPGHEQQQSGHEQHQTSSPADMFNNPLFGDLAKEIGNTFNFDEMEKEGKPQNIGEALSRFMSGNNPAKLMELVGKFGGKLQEEVKKGNINPADLLKQTMSAAGGEQNVKNMMNNPKMKQQMQQMQKQQQQSNSPARDRMRAKLDKKHS